MTEDEKQTLAAQLKKPHGELGGTVAEFMNIGNAILYKNTLNELILKDGDHVLEIGMANGFFTKDIFKINENIKYFGVDYSPEMVKKAEGLNEELILNKKAQFLHGEAQSLPFSDGTIDIVLSINTVYFFENTVDTLSELNRVLKSNGQLILGLRPENEMIQYPVTPYGFNTYDRSKLSSLLEAANFDVDRIFEKKEPNQDLNGISIPVSSMIGVGIKK